MNHRHTTALAAILAAAAGAAAQSYTVREITPVSGDGATYAWDVNNPGIVMGVSQLADASGTETVFYDASGRIAVMSAIGGTDLPYVWAGAINDQSTFVGTEITVNLPLGTTTRSFVSALDLLPTRFPLFAFNGLSCANDINDASPPTSVGQLRTEQTFGQSAWTVFHAFRVVTDGQNNPPVALGTLGGPFSHAEAINDEGVVVGVSLSTAGPMHAFIAPPGAAMTELGTLGGPVSWARDINNAGVVVGWSRLPDGSARAFRWQKGTMTALGTVGGEYSEANGINTPGVAVGMSIDAQGRPRAVRFDGLSAIDLNSRIPAGEGWTLQYAQSINDSGTIVGWGRRAGRTRGFILEPAGSCYANCDSSTTAPVLNIQDFTCFLNAFANSDPYANCDSSTSTPTLNIQDFVCFLNAFAAGCP